MTLVKLNGRPAVNYDNFFHDFFNFPSLHTNQASSGSVATNVYETPAAYQLELNVPGRNKEDFKISVDKGLLTISFEKKEETVNEDVKSIRREFRFENFTRTFTLDEKINADAIQAKYENGILKIELPKKEQVKVEPKQIAIS